MSDIPGNTYEPEDWAGMALQVGQQAAQNYANRYAVMDSRRWQEEMWRTQAEYNTPYNQRKRLEEAGINPNLAFGSSASASFSGGMPSTDIPHYKGDLGEYYLKMRQAKAQIALQNSERKRYDTLTDMQDLQNQMMSMLFNDLVQTKRGDMYVKRIEQAWKEDHLKELLDAGLQSKEVQNDLMYAQQLYYTALKEQSEKAKEKLIQEIDHLSNKYAFEDYFYDMRVNPYETSTPLGFIRSIFGPFSQMMEYIISLF